jgi:hypothetical protein
MADALAAGTLTITEVGTGTVPNLAATNASDRDTLVLDGEQLIGSRQNRMTNRSMLLRSDTVCQRTSPARPVNRRRVVSSSGVAAESARLQTSRNLA